MDDNTATLLGLLITSIAGVITTFLKERSRRKEEKRNGDAPDKDQISDSDDDS